jgi:amylosucrase
MAGAPWDAHTLADEALSGLSADRQQLFAVRLDRWWPDLRSGLSRLYDAPVADLVALRLVALATAAYRDRDPDLHRLDLERTLRTDWLQEPRMLGYAAYTERFADDLAGLPERLGYLQELGVTYLHLMPLLQDRPGDSDGGYAVTDYRAVRAGLGSVDDLRKLARSLRERGVSLVLDLVLNHVAREHEWAQAARGGSERHRAYFHVFDTRELPDAYEQTLPEVFPDFAPGNFTWDDDLDGWIWTTFNSFQWDVNWSNPEVLLEYAEIVLFLANAGVEVLRLDAIAFMWKRLGTTCQNQPEVHSITQTLRAVARIACPAVAFKAEAIVGPNDLVHYLGRGEHHGRVSDLAYHNTLMVQIWSMLATGDTRLGAHALRSLPPAPSTSAWITYLRCHDDIGWAIDDGDAAAVGLSGPAHRSFLSDWYTGEFPGSPARGLTFQHNPATGDRRVSGTAASLVGLEAARTRSDSAGVQASLDRLFLAHALVLGWGGVPVLWSGDELGMPNDPRWADEPGHAGDNRWAHRPRMDWNLAAQRRDLTSIPSRVFTGLAHLARVRAGLPHLHASVPTVVLPDTDPGLLATARRHPLGTMVGLYNVSGDWRPWPGGALGESGLRAPVDAITGEAAGRGEDGNLWLPPYAARWLVDPREDATA